MRIAFIGLGNMGGPMASNLVKAGHTVQVFDLSEAACRQLAEAGATVAASASDAVADLNGDQVPLHPMRIWPD